MWCQKVWHMWLVIWNSNHIRLESFKSANPLNGATLTSSGCGKLKLSLILLIKMTEVVKKNFYFHR